MKGTEAGVLGRGKQGVSGGGGRSTARHCRAGQGMGGRMAAEMRLQGGCSGKPAAGDIGRDARACARVAEVHASAVSKSRTGSSTFQRRYPRAMMQHVKTLMPTRNLANQPRLAGEIFCLFVVLFEHEQTNKNHQLFRDNPRDPQHIERYRKNNDAPENNRVTV